ncbi:TPA: cytochrome [Escherichia coli]|nr:cytochrome [Escherichia coli]HBZ8229036.1 cytochrome [Escherichia coli]HBZ8345764.1 cytochrome [Escherichia coli]HBZ8350833.1 cytochrome [Escherichia coli]HBZ8356165.1 cytochrome [Escherichia coli]
MNFQEMLSALSPKREPVELAGFKFYARPMTLSEYGEGFIASKDGADVNDQMILKCIQNEDGTPVFNSIDEVTSLYTTVRSVLTGAIQKASFHVEKTPDEMEKS